MIALHIMADFHLQGLFINLKQKKWWKEQLITYSDAKRKFYEYDNVVALSLHAFEWTFFIMIPIFLLEKDISFILIAFILNVIIHAVIDDCKCNKEIINLVQDQSIHLLQIVITWFIFFFIL